MRLAIGGGTARFDIEVYDSADVEVTGLVTGNFTKYLTIDGVTDAGTVTVTEIANGRYTVTFTAPAVTAGNVKYVRCRVLHATHAPRGFAEDFEVYNVNVLSGVTQTGDTYALANGANGFVATKVDTAAILVDTAVIGATGGGLTSLAQASVCTEARLAELDAANLPTDVAAVKSDTAAILVDTGTTLDGRIPAALVSGRMDASVGAVAADALTAAALAADAVTEIQAGLATAAALTTAAASAATAATKATLAADILEGDEEIDKTTDATQWQQVVYTKSTSTELVRKKLWKSDGTTKIASDDDIVGERTE